MLDPEDSRLHSLSILDPDEIAEELDEPIPTLRSPHDSGVEVRAERE